MLLDFETYRELYSEAKEYDDLDLYISERGWQDWMADNIDEDVKILTKIYKISRYGVKELLEIYGGTQAAFAREFLTPKRTVESWAEGTNAPPERTIMMTGYALVNRKSDNA